MSQRRKDALEHRHRSFLARRSIMEDDHAAGTDGEQDVLRRVGRRDWKELQRVGRGHGAPVAVAMELVEHAAIEPAMAWTEPSHRTEAGEQLVGLQQLTLKFGGG